MKTITNRSLEQEFVEKSLFGELMLVLIALPVSLTRIFFSGFQTTQLVHIIGSIFILLMYLLRKQIKYHALKIMVIIGLLFISIPGLISYGFASAAPAFFTFTISIITIIYSKKIGLISLVAYILISALMAILFVSETLRSSIDFNAYLRSYNAWIVVLLPIMIQAYIFIVALSTYKDKIWKLSSDLSEKNELLTLASSVAKFGYWVYDAKTEEIEWNDSTYTIFEIDDHSELMSLPKFLEFLNKTEQDNLLNIFEDSIRTQSSYEILHPIMTRKNNQRFLIEKGIHLYDEKGHHLRTLGTVYDVTDINDAQNKLVEINQELDSILEATSIAASIGKFGYWELDPKTSISKCSPSLFEILETDYDENGISITEFLDYLPQKDQVRLNEVLTLSIKYHKEYSLIHQLITKKGNKKFIEEKGKHYYDEKGHHIKSIGTTYDVTERMRKEASLNDKNEELIKAKTDLEIERFKYKNILDIAIDGIVLMDLEGKVLEYSKEFQGFLGYSEEYISQNITVFDWDKDLDIDSWNEIVKSMENGPISVDRIHTRHDGTTYNASINAKIVNTGIDAYIYASVRDNTEYVKALNTIKEQSNRDYLTHLYNRKAFYERMSEQISQFKRYDLTFSLLMIDIDLFKDINDSHGHLMGDQVLLDLARQFEENLRTNDYSFRVGGEEFAIILTGTDFEQAKQCAEKIRLNVEKNLNTLSEFNKHVTISIGLSEINKSDTIESIYKRADDLLYRSKETGRNKVSY